LNRYFESTPTTMRLESNTKAAAGLMSRFPARQQPTAKQNAARLRDNQRRHRARVKAHTTQLEAQLAETKIQLDAARDEIARLTREVESLRRGLPVATEQHTNADPVDHTLGNDNATSSFGEPTLVNTVQERACSSASNEPPRPQCSGSCDQKDQSNMNTLDGAAHALQNQQPDNVLVAIMSESEESCNNLPAPQSGESTTPCVDAYQVIEQQNFAGLDVATIARWLKPGFRSATEKGGGCRVDTQLLFVLLDHITSSQNL